jgi:hypothetical protein
VSRNVTRAELERLGLGDGPGAPGNAPSGVPLRQRYYERSLTSRRPASAPCCPNSGVCSPAQRALDAYLETLKRFVANAASVGGESHEIRSVAAPLDEVLKPIRLPDDPLAASYAIGGVLQIELARKQQLELTDAASRLRAEIELLHREARLLADGNMPPVAAADLSYNPN